MNGSSVCTKLERPLKSLNKFDVFIVQIMLSDCCQSAFHFLLQDITLKSYVTFIHNVKSNNQAGIFLPESLKFNSIRPNQDLDNDNKEIEHRNNLASDVNETFIIKEFVQTRYSNFRTLVR